MKTFVVIGLGRFGIAVATQLFNMGYEVLCIDKDINKVNAVADSVTQAICADAKDEHVLKAMGIRNYDCAVVAIGGELSDSILVTLLLKEMNLPKIVCKALDRNHKKVLQKIGADTVIIPEFEAGKKTAVNIVSNSITAYIELSDRYSIAEVVTPKGWVGSSIRELDLRRKYSVNVVAVMNGSETAEMNVTPSPEYVFQETDIIIMIGEIETINALNER